ncbi:HET-domain-containing protein [Aspergillus sclerotiicarbonarius CBS 121057]|uniref:HET-domain-containing protein n=1 Tax=Aspergillus sclerotiicarbonarius (strain CBS 121057 / IBT 28362) TaxID=1448318 RepID=A0A319EVV2_ASPSB|nr:HET-domain-containing protein [Aspergillus sclerotiicarbonarius CBS 121057]
MDMEFNFKVELSLPDPGIEWRLCRETLLGTLNSTSGNELFSVRRPQNVVNWNKVSGWLDDCDNGIGHQSCCHVKPEQPPIQGFRVIDTERRCIVFAPLSCEYITLSYVWGATDTSLQATTKNIDYLSTEGYLTGSNLLPQTIDDAITACSKLQLRYLWVDRLCILQDDEPSKKAIHLNAMGVIYNQSYLTIVALAGNNAEYGLPGAHRVKRPAQWTGSTQGIFLIDQIPEYDDCLKQSKWTTRGVFYECCGTSGLRDENYGKVSSPETKVRVPMSSYGDLVRDFTRRDLAYESDILRAFKGILHTEWGLNHLLDD